MNPPDPPSEALIAAVAAWAAAGDDLRALALVGSRARGEARPDSDIDFVLLAVDPERLLDERGWIARFGRAGSVALEDWGRLRSLRVRCDGGSEVEFGVAAPDWAALPLDAGTAGVLRGGCRILLDRDGSLSDALRAAGAGGRPSEARAD